MSARYSDKFTEDAVPPFDAPQGVLAWAALPTGNVFLTAKFDWVDAEDPGRARIFNSLMRNLDPGPADGPMISRYCQIIRVFYDYRWPVYERIVEYFGDEDTIY